QQLGGAGGGSSY
ncbi:unnamed protein product, partial [Rotaria socialis]